MPPYRANVGGMFGSGQQPRPGGNIDIGSAIREVGNQASSLIHGAYLRKMAQQTRDQQAALADQQRAEREEAKAARAAEAATRAERDRVQAFTTQLQQEKMLREMGYVPEGQVVPTPDVRVPGTMGAVPVGPMVDAARLGDVRQDPSGRLFRLDRLQTPQAQSARKDEATARRRQVERTEDAAEAERRERMRAARGRGEKTEDAVEAKVRDVVARAAMEGIPVEGAMPDFITGKVPMRKATEQELDALARRVRSVLKGEVQPAATRQAPPPPPDVDPAEWEQYLRETGQLP